MNVDGKHTSTKSTVDMLKNNQIDDCAGSLDTNILLRYVLNDVESQAAAVQKMLAGENIYVVADHAIFEMVFVLERTYAFQRAEIGESVDAIIHHGRVTCDTYFIEKVLSLYVQEEKLSIIDCAILEYARQQQALPLKTFDKDMIKRSAGDASAPRV